MLNNMIETYTLNNGLRIVAAPSATDVVYCGIAVDAGTRDEAASEEGMAHFTEHLSFKGTRRRRSWHILNRMEVVGGDLNAYTGKEETVYYCTFLKQHFSRAVDLLLDVVLNSTYPQSEMDKEVEVVIDEIESYNDSPSELIFDEFENLIFQGHPLGHSILGNAEGLRKMKSEDVVRFTKRLYRPERMVLYVLGNIPMKKIIKEVEKCIPAQFIAGNDKAQFIAGNDKAQECVGNGLKTDEAQKDDANTFRNASFSFDADVAGKEFVVHKETHQAHVVIGTRAFSATDPRHLHLYLLNNILGGPGMNSRLNLALRERNGLVYTVESSSTCYTDTGCWSVYFGCDPDDVNRCKKLVLRELARLAEAPLSESALSSAKRQIIGQIGVSYDSFENVAIGMGKRFLHYNATQSYEQLCSRVEALTAEELFQTACELFQPERMTTLIYK